MQTKFAISSKQLSVTIDSAGNGFLLVEDKRIQQIWHSGDSLLRINTYDLPCDRVCGQIKNEYQLLLAYHNEQELGLTVKCTALGIRFLISFKLEQDILKVTIPYAELQEHKANIFRLLAIELMPCAFSAKTGDDGYLLLPNYSGLLSRFKNRSPQQYRTLLYVPQAQWEDASVLPVFGTVHQSVAVEGIIESGDFDAGIVASLNWGESQIYSIHPEFHYRHHHSDMVDPVDRVVSYHFLSKDDAGYVGMAKRYRSYLIETKGLVPLKEKSVISPDAAYMCEAYGFLKIFCAQKIKMPDGSCQYHPGITFQRALQILKRLKSEGIEKIRCILVGWNWDGHDGRYPTRFPVDARLGGEEGLKTLIEAADKMDYRITFHDNYSDAYSTSPDWDESIMIRDRQGNLYPGGVWAGGQSYFPCPALAEKRFMHRDLPRIKDLGVRGWYYLDGTPRALRGCYDKTHGHLLTRRAEAEGIMDQFQTVRAYFGGCAVEMPTAFVLPAVDEVAHIPCLGVWNLRPEFKAIIDEVTPFFHIAVHGLVIYHLIDWQHYPKLFGSITNGVLKAAEWGAMPRNEIFPSDNIDEHVHWIKKEYNLFCKHTGKLQMEFIESHCQIDEHCYETTYSDQTRVTVDYQQLKIMIDDNEVIGVSA